MKKLDNVYELTPEIFKTLSSTGCSGRTMKKENDIIMMKNILRDVGYTGKAGRVSNRKTFFTILHPKLVEKTQSKTIDEVIESSDVSQGEGVKIIRLSNIFDIYT